MLAKAAFEKRSRATAAPLTALSVAIERFSKYMNPSQADDFLVHLSPLSQKVGKLTSEAG